MYCICIALFSILLAVVMERDTMPISRHHRDFAIRKFHVITETFLSFVGTDTPQDVELLVQVMWLVLLKRCYAVL